LYLLGQLLVLLICRLGAVYFHLQLFQRDSAAARD
jgi:hypothetical protein